MNDGTGHDRGRAPWPARPADADADATRPGPWGGASAGPVPCFADHYDGTRALPRRVALRVEADGPSGAATLVLTGPEGTRTRWPMRAVHRLPDQPDAGFEGAVAWSLGDDGVARLVTDDPPATALLHREASPPGRRTGPTPLWRRALLVSGLGGALLAVLLTIALPTLAGILARLLSPEAQIALGDRLLPEANLFLAGGDVPMRVCDDAAGRAALDALVARVAQADGRVPPRVLVLDDRSDPIANAFALPGGYVVFLDTIVQLADDPEELAAILAHELGHVVHRHPVQGLLQSSSTAAIAAVLTGDLTGGGLAGALAGRVLNASHSRKAETEADLYAIARLRAVGIAPDAAARIFERLSRRAGAAPTGVASHLATHPALDERIAMARAAAPPAKVRPALDAADWAALRGICDRT